jgi:hypothetical protein
VRRIDLSGFPRHEYVCEEEIVQSQPQSYEEGAGGGGGSGGGDAGAVEVGVGNVNQLHRAALVALAEKSLPLTLAWNSASLFTFRCSAADSGNSMVEDTQRQQPPGEGSQWYHICGARLEPGATSNTIGSTSTWRRDALFAIAACATGFALLALHIVSR